MTVRWSTYAQSRTAKPVKGMLTGPVTILQWSFVRDDQPRAETAKQLALAIRDEVKDLEAAGIRVIQIDEPALREGLPLRRADWPAYIEWAVNAFRLATASVKAFTAHSIYAGQSARRNGRPSRSAGSSIWITRIPAASRSLTSSRIASASCFAVSARG